MTTEQSPPSIKLILRRDQQRELKDDVLVVVSKTGWNDFGYHLRADFGFMGSSSQRLWIPGYLAFKGQKESLAFLKTRLQGGLETIDLTSDLAYAAMLKESKYYAEMRSSFGGERARVLLDQLHDVSLLSERGDPVPHWDDFFKSEPFTLAMTRDSEGHFTFREGARIIAGKNIDGIDAKANFSARLTGDGPPLKFDFQFANANALRGRMAIIIGKNGCGKTSSVWRLAGGLSTKGLNSASIDPRPDVNQVLLFAHSGALSQFRDRLGWSDETSVRTFSLDPVREQDRIFGETQTRPLVDIARAVYPDFTPLIALTDILDAELPHLKLYIPVRADRPFKVNDEIEISDEKYMPLSSFNVGGEERKLQTIGSVDHQRDLMFLDAQGRPRGLSLGQAAFFNFALNALANAGPASVILIDEPENFLHPNLVSRFMRSLHLILEATSSIGIIATHSPFVVREVQSAQVHIIADGNEHARLVIHPLMQTLGANVTAISNEVFGDDLSDHLFEILVEEAELLKLPFEQVIEQYAAELSTEALMFIRRRKEERNGLSSPSGDGVQTQ